MCNLTFIEEVNDNGLKGKATDSITAPLSHNFTFPTRETLEKNGEHAVVCATTRLVEDDGGIREVANITNVETSILDPHTGVIYAITGKLLKISYTVNSLLLTLYS